MTAIDGALSMTLLRRMTLLRTFDRAAKAAYGRGDIHGTYRGSLGQEAIPVGVCHALDEGDLISPGLRAVGDLLARGADPATLMAELFARADGLCGGRGGALHLADAEHGAYGGFGVMTANVPMAMGMALAAHVRRNRSVVACFVGDRAMNQGVFHETLNAAALLSLPLLFVGVNNAPDDATTRFSDHTAAGSMTALAAVHGIDAEVVDGTDVLVVHERTSATVAALRDGAGPAFFECRCFPLDEPSRDQTEAWMEEMRRSGRYEGLLAVKKRKIGTSELSPPAHWLEGDPVTKLRTRLVDELIATVGELDELDVAVRTEVEAAVAAAAASPPPDPDEGPAQVFAERGHAAP